MKKILVLWCGVIICFLSSGCTDNMKDDPSNTRVELQVHCSATGNLTQQEEATVVLYSQDIPSDDLEKDVYLKATTATMEYVCYVGRSEKVTLDTAELMLADLDEDSCDEIVLYMEVTGNGATIAQVFEVSDGQMVMIKDLSSVGVELTTEFLGDYQLKITNADFDFSTTIDVSKEYPAEFFDKEGKGTGAGDITLWPISACVVKNQNSLSPTVYCYRSAKCTNFIGGFTFAFQYDRQTQKIVLKSIDFQETGDG